MTDSAVIAKRPACYQDVLDAPDTMVAELIHGALRLQPRPAPLHAVAGSSLGGELVGPFQKGRGGPGGWWILDEPELHLGPDVLVPDLAGWRRTRMPVMPATAYFPLAPDWVCEVLSPGTREYDVTEKRDIYGREGVAHLWQVDPDSRTLEAFGLEHARWVLMVALHGEAEVRVPPFDAISFDLSALWA
ncbi:MAG: Uma2 family endonuclease [Alphaproteobacteria bacterium]|nr:Uma2 family endonuclease [Alphaproteobacteria bacterium]